jgi:hypothetical protein
MYSAEEAERGGGQRVLLRHNEAPHPKVTSTALDK